MKFGLTQKVIELIRNALAESENIENVYIFGSRVRASYRENSDIDLAVIFKNESENSLARLTARLEDLPLLYKFDVVDLEKISDNKFLQTIKMEMQEF